MILYLNACVRKASRTAELASYLLDKLYDSVTEVKIHNIKFPVADEDFINLRSSLVEKGALSDPMFDLAVQFSKADTIVISAPFWDLSFPAALKQYFEQINVVGITFEYNEKGIPVGLCRAKKLYYITTAGGPIYSDEYGFGYVKTLAENFYHIPGIYQIKAENLDIYGADVPAILAKAKKNIDEIF